MTALRERFGVSAVPAEALIAGAMLAITSALSLAYGLPFNTPSGERAAFVGVHYLYPLIGIAIWAAIVVFARKQPLGATFFIALPCYALVLLCHFNLKLWIGHINPVLWDPLYWQTDQLVRPLIEGAMALRGALDPVIPLDSNFYMSGFIAMFYLAFGFGALQRPESFRELVLGAILLQALGSLAYLIAPAIGPFLYESGVEPRASAAQAMMFGSYQANMAGGAAWLAAEGGRQITVGLAAMPSLHAGGSFLFLAFAWRHARPLLWVMVPLFAFISIDALANRWHYLIDLPAGIALAVLSLGLAARIVRAQSDALVRPAPAAVSRPARAAAAKPAP